jgi:hypothetical protein
MNGDDGFESERLLLAEEHVFVVMSFHEVEGQAPRHSMPGLVKRSALPAERQRGRLQD